MQQDRIYELFQQRAKIKHPFGSADNAAVTMLEGKHVMHNPEILVKGVYSEAKGRVRVLRGLLDAGVRAWAENFGSINTRRMESLFQAPNGRDEDTQLNFEQKAVAELVSIGDRPKLLVARVNSAVKNALAGEFLAQAEEARGEGDIARFTGTMDVLTGVMLAELPARLRGSASTSQRKDTMHAFAGELAMMNPGLLKQDGRLAEAKQIKTMAYSLHNLGDGGDQVFLNDMAVSLMQTVLQIERPYASHPTFTEVISLEHYLQVAELDGSRDPEVGNRNRISAIKKWMMANLSPQSPRAATERFFVPPEADINAVRLGSEIYEAQAHGLLTGITERVSLDEFKRYDSRFVLGRIKPGPEIP